jgi:NADH dehydrogenase
VLAFGTRANLDLVPGLAEHALPLKLIGDALFIRNRVLQRMARIELETRPVLRRRLGHFVVDRRRLLGVEVAGTLADFLPGATATTRASRPTSCASACSRAPTAAARAARIARPRRAAVAAPARHRRPPAARRGAVDADGVRLGSGERARRATVVCTIGTRPNPLAAQLGCRCSAAHRHRAGPLGAGRRRRLGARRLRAVRNDAAPPHGAPRSPARSPTRRRPRSSRSPRRASLPPTSRPASRAADPRLPPRVAGAMATDRPPQGRRAAVRPAPRRPAGWLLWRAYYLLQMPTLGRKVRIWVEWTWAMFFAADITHLRFTRTTRSMPTPAPIPFRHAAAAPRRPADFHPLKETPCSSRNLHRHRLHQRHRSRHRPRLRAQGADVMLNGFGNADEIEFTAPSCSASAASRCAIRTPT